MLRCVLVVLVLALVLVLVVPRAVPRCHALIHVTWTHERGTLVYCAHVLGRDRSQTLPDMPAAIKADASKVKVVQMMLLGSAVKIRDGKEDEIKENSRELPCTRARPRVRSASSSCGAPVRARSL